MRQIFREIGRAPVRLVTSVFALALAIGAIGVFAIPTVSTASLRDAAEHDGIPQIIVRTTETGTVDVVDALSRIDNVERVEPQIATGVTLQSGLQVDLLGVEFDGAQGPQQIDIIRPERGRLPVALGEVLVSAGTAEVGDELDVATTAGGSTSLTVVGVGGTTFWNDFDIAFATLETAELVDGSVGANRLVIHTDDQSKQALRVTASEARDVLAADGIVTTTLPVTIPDGRHPIEAEIEQISTLVGLLGVVAGVVALVLLASTTNTLITERTREVAVMRALGGTNRQLRRRLRRLALGIAAAAVVLGIPLGIAISNFIARMILDEFVGITPEFAVSIPVMVASAVFGLLGARLVAARAARRVTNRPLAEALRDRDGSPFGRRWSERIAARVGGLGLLDRTALRNGVHQRARSLAMLAQITAAVAALLVIASLATTVTSYERAADAPALWATRAYVPGPGLDIDRTIADTDPRSEVGANVAGEVDGWEVGLFGFEPETQMIDRTMESGRWFDEPGEVALSAGFAGRIGADIGDTIAVELASGSQSYTVVGLHPDRDRTVFIDVDELATDMGVPGKGNILLSLDEEPATVIDGPYEVERNTGDDGDGGTDAILLIFGAVGAIVVAVAGLAVASGLAVNVYERRHEFAALRAIGARRRHVFRVVLAELLPLGALGLVLGVVAGYAGAWAIIDSFEASNAIEIGFTFDTSAVPMAATVVLVGSIVLGGLMVRRATRQPAAVTLRGAA